MALTVLQRIASKQQMGLLLVPAIKGAVYINTHCNYSQPVLTKLYNENIGGHSYTFTIRVSLSKNYFNGRAVHRKTSTESLNSIRFGTRRQ